MQVHVVVSRVLISVNAVMWHTLEQGSWDRPRASPRCYMLHVQSASMNISITGAEVKTKQRALLQS